MSADEAEHEAPWDIRSRIAAFEGGGSKATQPSAPPVPGPSSPTRTRPTWQKPVVQASPQTDPSSSTVTPPDAEEAQPRLSVKDLLGRYSGSSTAPTTTTKPAPKSPSPSVRKPPLPTSESLDSPAQLVESAETAMAAAPAGVSQDDPSPPAAAPALAARKPPPPRPTQAKPSLASASSPAPSKEPEAPIVVKRKAAPAIPSRSSAAAEAAVLQAAAATSDDEGRRFDSPLELSEVEDDAVPAIPQRPVIPARPKAAASSVAVTPGTDPLSAEARPPPALPPRTATTMPSSGPTPALPRRPSPSSSASPASVEARSEKPFLPPPSRSQTGTVALPPPSRSQTGGVAVPRNNSVYHPAGRASTVLAPRSDNAYGAPAGPSVLDTVNWNFDEPIEDVPAVGTKPNGTAVTASSSLVRLSDPDASSRTRYKALYDRLRGSSGAGGGVDRRRAIVVWHKSKLDPLWLERVYSKALEWQENQRLIDDALDENAPKDGSSLGLEAFVRAMAAIDSELLDRKLGE